MQSLEFMDLPTLEQISDRAPLLVPPQMPVMDVIAAMYPSRTDTNVPAASATSCALVVDGTNLIGIFTEQDVVQLTAAGQALADLPVSQVLSAPLITLG